MSDHDPDRAAALACANEACRNMSGELDLGAMTDHFAKYRTATADDLLEALLLARQLISDLSRNCIATISDQFEIEEAVDAAIAKAQSQGGAS